MDARLGKRGETRATTTWPTQTALGAPFSHHPLEPLPANIVDLGGGYFCVLPSGLQSPVDLSELQALAKAAPTPTPDPAPESDGG